jgi:hypothetical protein
MKNLNSIIFLFRQKEDEDRRNKMAALAAVRAAKAAINASIAVSEEIKDEPLPSVIPSTVITSAYDDKICKISKDM